jgi:hypothetical protein
VLLMTSKPDHMLHCPPPNPRSKKKKKQLHRARDYVATNGWLSKGCNRLTSGTARNPCFKKAQKRTLSVPSTLRMDGIGMRGKSRKNIRHQIMQRGCCCCCCVVLWFCYNEVPHSNKPVSHHGGGMVKARGCNLLQRVAGQRGGTCGGRRQLPGHC